jgi:hypothetical protein
MVAGSIPAGCAPLNLVFKRLKRPNGAKNRRTPKTQKNAKKGMFYGLNCQHSANIFQRVIQNSEHRSLWFDAQNQTNGIKQSTAHDSG